MCYLDAIAGPEPIFLGGTVLLAVAVGLLLLCGIVLVTVGIMKAAKEKATIIEEPKDPEI